MDELYLYFYDNIDKLIGDDLLLIDKDPIVKVEDIFNIEFDMNTDDIVITDDILILYLLCIHKMSTIKHENIIRRKLIQFFNYHKLDGVQLGGSHLILLNTIKQYIRHKVSLIQPKPKSIHLE